MFNVSVVIPWRSDGGHRDRLFDWNLRRWEWFLPNADIVTSDSEDEDFNRGQARNLAVEKAIGDILIIADADTALPDQENLKDAIELASQGKWVVPYRVYYNTSSELTEEILKTSPAQPIEEPRIWEHRLTDSVAGVLVLPRAAFDRVNGYDERFKGWGGEDRAFALALGTLWGERTVLAGYILHLWHPRGEATFEQPDWPHNADLLDKYQRAKGWRSAMEELIG